MERCQKKIHRKDELTWSAHILTCSPHVLSHVLALNGTCLLAVTCPCKNQAGWPFWCPYRNVVLFSLEPCTGKPTLKSHRSKLGLRSTSLNAKIIQSRKSFKTNRSIEQINLRISVKTWRISLSIMFRLLEEISSQNLICHKRVHHSMDTLQ